MLATAERKRSAALADEFARHCTPVVNLDIRGDYLLAAYRLRGEAAVAALRAQVSPTIWRHGRCWQSPADDHRLWGTAAFGGFAAGMIGSALGLSGGQLEQARLIGARINLFVSLYDHVLDSGTPAEEILSADFESGSSCSLIPQLIRGLFLEVGREELLLEGMRRMAYGENHYQHLPEDTLSWRRKNGLIPVVMALAVRAATGDPAPLPLPLLAQCYRLGLWAGWLDDVCDLDQDARDGQPNRVAAEQLSDMRALVQLTQRLYLWWSPRVPQPDLVDAFFYCATREINRARMVPA